MGTEVLRPHDCLVERIRSPPSSSVFNSPRRSNGYCYYYNNYSQCYVNNYSFTLKPNRKQQSVVVRSDGHHRKPQQSRDATFSRRSSSVDDLKLSRNRNAAGGGDHFPVEKLAILRRGESLEMKIGGGDKEISEGKSDVLYAGSAFAVSPAPSSLPLPSFSKAMKISQQILVDDSATRDLRRLLRLDM